MEDKELKRKDYQAPGMKEIEIRTRRVLCGSNLSNVGNPFGGDDYGDEQIL